MTIRPRISPLTWEEIAFLRRPENADLYEAYGDALAGLHGFASRYSGSWYFVRIPDEEEALERLAEDAARLSSVPSLCARMRANDAAVLEIRDAALRDGLTEAVREAATDLMAAFIAESEALSSSETEFRASRRVAAG